MFHGRFVKKADPQVDLVFEQTKSGNIKWENTGFSEPNGTSFKISFTADDGQRELILKKESFLENGGWVSTDNSVLTVKDKNTGQESTHAYHESSDYVETLEAAGYLPVSELARFVIDQFRPTMNLHWSIM